MTNRSELLIAIIAMYPVLTSFLGGLDAHEIHRLCKQFAGDKTEAASLAGRICRQLDAYEAQGRAFDAARELRVV